MRSPRRQTITAFGATFATATATTSAAATPARALALLAFGTRRTGGGSIFGQCQIAAAIDVVFQHWAARLVVAVANFFVAAARFLVAAARRHFPLTGRRWRIVPVQGKDVQIGLFRTK